MEVYRLSLFAGDLGWRDATKLMRDRRTLKLSDQLYSAVGSISANLAEGYSRSSHKDQARFYEYSLGSAREARNWYFEGRHVLGEPIASHRMQLLTQIIRHLLNIIPSERGYSMKEEPATYQIALANSDPENLLRQIPMPEETLDATRNT
ncbi:MAG: four helix bundle protein [Verrucomicrobiota bacterium]